MALTYSSTVSSCLAPPLVDESKSRLLIATSHLPCRRMLSSQSWGLEHTQCVDATGIESFAVRAALAAAATSAAAAGGGGAPLGETSALLDEHEIRRSKVEECKAQAKTVGVLAKFRYLLDRLQASAQKQKQQQAQQGKKEEKEEEKEEDVDNPGVVGGMETGEYAQAGVRGHAPGYLLHHPIQSVDRVDWESLAEGVDPSSVKWCDTDAQRKRDQVANLCAAFATLLPLVREAKAAATAAAAAAAAESPTGAAAHVDIRASRVRCVEFCGGTGHFAVVAAALHPDTDFILMDQKGESLDMARERVEKAQLRNVFIVQQTVEDYSGGFDIGVSLHACGPATDLTHRRCLQARAAYVLCPCCVGKVKYAEKNRQAHARQHQWMRAQQMEAEEEVQPDHVSLPPLCYPRSAHMRTMLSEREYMIFAKAADFGHREMIGYNQEERYRRMCKSWVERDRNMYAEEDGYETGMFILHPNTASPKNDVIIGWPSEWRLHLPGAKSAIDPRPLEEVLFSHIAPPTREEEEGDLLPVPSPRPARTEEDSEVCM